MVKQGSRWTDNNGKVFYVIDVVQIEGHVWVYYRNESKDNPNEYSCYIESFLSRFRSLPE